MCQLSHLAFASKPLFWNLNRQKFMKGTSKATANVIVERVIGKKQNVILERVIQDQNKNVSVRKYLLLLSYE